QEATQPAKLWCRAGESQLLLARVARPDRNSAAVSGRNVALSNHRSALDNNVFYANGILFGIFECGLITNPLGVECDQVCPRARIDSAKFGQTKRPGSQAGHLADRVFERQNAKVPRIAAEDSRKRSIGARVRPAT